jgi:long-chain acyl-CoA synthetase
VCRYIPLTVYRLNTQTLQSILLQSSQAFGDAPALSMRGAAPLSYRDLLPRAQVLAALLAGQGITRGDRVALISENTPNWGVAYFAVTSMGAVVVPILTDFTAAQVGTIVTHAGCRSLIVSDKCCGKIAGARSGRLVVRIEDFSVQPSGSGETAPARSAGFASAFELPPVAEDDLAAIIYTSGTTGHSKGVMLSHRSIVSNAWATRTIIELGPSDRLLSILPLAHTYECTLGLVAALMQGASVTYLDRPPTAAALMPALAELRPTVILSVPLVMEKIFRSKILPELERRRLYGVPLARRLFNRIAGARLMKLFGGRIRFFGIGGAALAPDVEGFLREARFPYAIGYGLTETAPLVAGSAPFRTHPRSTGPALAGVDIRIAAVDGSASPGPRGGEGEVQVRGPNVMKGYFADPDRTAEAFTADGWFRTGDLGAIDARGRLAIRGRLKTMILGASGENIYPEEIEAVINGSEFVGESLVYGGESGVTALVHLKPEVLESLMARVQDGIAKAETSVNTLLERIRKEVNAQLAAFSRIHRMELQRIPFEKTPTQKIKRFLYPPRG